MRGLKQDIAQDRTRLLLMTYRKSLTRFRLVSKSTTLDDLEGHYALCFNASFGAHRENLNEDRLYCQQRRCSRMTLDSDIIRFMRILAGVPWKGGVIQQWVIENVFFSGFRTLRIRHLRKWGQHYYILLFSPLSSFHWFQNTWPWMSLKWLFEGPFYVKCSLLRTATD